MKQLAVNFFLSKRLQGKGQSNKLPWWQHLIQLSIGNWDYVFMQLKNNFKKKNPKSTNPQWRDLAAAPLAASGNFDCGDCILWRQQHCHSHIYTDIYEYFNISCQETAAVAATRMLRFGAQRQLQPFAYWRSRCEAAIKAMLRKKLEQCLQANKSTLNAILMCSALFWSFCSASVTAFVSFLFYVPFLV